MSNSTHSPNSDFRFRNDRPSGARDACPAIFVADLSFVGQPSRLPGVKSGE